MKEHHTSTPLHTLLGLNLFRLVAHVGTGVVWLSTVSLLCENNCPSLNAHIPSSSSHRRLGLFSRYRQLVKITDVHTKWSNGTKQVFSRKSSMGSRSFYLGLSLRQHGCLSPKAESPHLPMIIQPLTLSQIPNSAFTPSSPLGKARKEF